MKENTTSILTFMILCFGLSGCASAPKTMSSKNGSKKFKITRGVTYKSAEGADLKADIYMPEGHGLRPSVLVVHGGAWSARSGDMEWICRDLAKAGFVAVNITYRLAPQNKFPKPVEDVRDAIIWLKENSRKYKIDSEKIAGWGYSAGANLLLLAGLDPSMGLKAIIAGGTPADLTAWPDSSKVLDFLGTSLEENRDLWELASPVNHVKDNSPPVFLYHGSWDWVVDKDQALKMKIALENKNVDHETYYAPFMGHIWTYYFSKESFYRAISFLNKHISLSDGSDD